MSQHWYIAKSKPNQEQLLKANRHSFGAEAFYPYVTSPGSSGKRKEALFPTYIFCQIDPSSPFWPNLRWAPGLAYFLGSPRGASFLPAYNISEIRARIEEWDEGGLRRAIPPQHQVIITAGPFQGLEGLFQRHLPAKERCIVLAKLLGEDVDIEISVEIAKEFRHEFRL